MKDIIREFILDLINAIRGLCEMLGFFIIMLCIFATNKQGVSYIVTMWNTSVGANGIFMTIIFSMAMLVLSWMFKNNLDESGKV